MGQCVVLCGSNHRAILVPMEKEGGNQATPVLLASANGFGLACLSERSISFTLMVHHIVLYKLKPEVTPARVEAMMMWPHV